MVGGREGEGGRLQKGVVCCVATRGSLCCHKRIVVSPQEDRCVATTEPLCCHKRIVVSLETEKSPLGLNKKVAIQVFHGGFGSDDQQMWRLAIPWGAGEGREVNRIRCKLMEPLFGPMHAHYWLITSHYRLLLAITDPLPAHYRPLPAITGSLLANSDRLPAIDRRITGH